MNLAIDFEQAQSPGEKSYGVAVLYMILIPAVLIPGLLGLGFFIALAIRRVRGMKLPG
jgi:hypothetical protein